MYIGHLNIGSNVTPQSLHQLSNVVTSLQRDSMLASNNNISHDTNNTCFSNNNNQNNNSNYNHSKYYTTNHISNNKKFDVSDTDNKENINNSSTRSGNSTGGYNGIDTGIFDEGVCLI